MSSNQVIIVHGYTGHPNKNWFPWLKEELEARNIQTTVPAMPNPEAPVLQEWLTYLQQLVPHPTPQTYFVGHSLGCISILRYLEQLPADSSIGGIVLAAGFIRNLTTHPQLTEFTNTPLNFYKCKEVAPHIVAINSDNDPYVPLEEGTIMEEKLEAKLVVYPNGGHLNEKSGLVQFPLLLNELLLLMKD